MRTLHVIMPMAGEGTRFMNEGYLTPKPLIEFKGSPLFLRAINSLKYIDAPKKYSFIVRQEHIDRYQVDEKIKAILPDANIVSVLNTTRGAVETCMLAQPFMDIDDAIVALDCDLEFYSKQFDKNVKEILSKPIEDVNGGVLVSFTAEDARYSFAEIDADNNVIRTAEKDPISNHALVGSYFFSKTDSFVYAANKLLAEPIFDKPEYYLSLLYNCLIKNEEIIKLSQIDEYYSYGTPEELKSYF